MKLYCFLSNSKSPGDACIGRFQFRRNGNERNQRKVEDSASVGLASTGTSDLIHYLISAEFGSARLLVNKLEPKQDTWPFHSMWRLNKSRWGIVLGVRERGRNI